eukprot:7463346-Pyramimonas_sp.AAC.3
MAEQDRHRLLCATGNRRVGSKRIRCAAQNRWKLLNRTDEKVALISKSGSKWRFFSDYYLVRSFKLPRPPWGIA